MMESINDMRDNKTQKFAEGDEVFSYGMSELKGKIVSIQERDHGFVYIVHMNNSEEHVLRDEESLQKAPFN